MKTLGLLGGTTWVSTVEYYRLLNQGINERLGGLNFCKCILYSINMEEVTRLKKADDQEGIIKLVLDAVYSLNSAGIDGLVLCANTLHFAVEAINKSYDIPIVHIANATADVIKKQGLSKVALLGTRQTMEQDFYTSILEKEGIETIVPELEDRKKIDSIIFTELAREEFHDATRDYLQALITSMHQKGAQGIVLGCTELPLILNQEQTDIPLFNTLNIHVDAAIEFILSGKE